MINQQDIIIIGAGFVGLTLAFAFAKQGKRVALLEAKALALQQQQQSLDGRAIALSRKSQHILNDVGIWPKLGEATPLTEVCVSEQGSFGKLYLKGTSVKPLGYVLPAPQLGKQLLTLCQQQENLTWLAPVIVENITQNNKSITVHLKEQGEISAALLIIAEGTQSLTRMQQAFSTWIKPYSQQATVANVSLTHPTIGVAYQRFTTDGTLALLPLQNKRFTLVWTSAQQAPLSDQDFLTKMQEILGHQLGTLNELGPRQTYPLKALFVEKAYNGRLLLMGNAAHTLSPIAAQGFNLTLRDIDCLLTLCASSDIQTSNVEAMLACYQEKRLADQKNMLRFTDGLMNIFHLPFIAPLRSLGLMTLNSLPFAKQRLFEHLLGY